MADVRLGVSADFGGVTSGMASIGQEATKLGSTLQRGMQYKPFDIKAVERDLKRYEQLVRDMQKRMDQLTRAPGAGAPGVGPGGAPFPPHPPALTLVPPSPTPPPPFLRDRQQRGRHEYTYAPGVSDIGRSLMGGFGGGVGTISSYATRGAIAGSRETEGQAGGMVGGGMGLMRGGLIGAGVLGAMKIGQGVSEGYDMAKDRALSMDALKRQMGDLGISFGALRTMAEAASSGLGINSKESTKLAEQFNSMSRNAERTTEGLASTVRTGVGMSRAYGLEPSAGVGFLGGMREINPRQNNRDLAVMLAETIGKSGMAGRSDEVMQAIQSFASATSRLSLSAPNVGAFAAGYGSLMSSGTPGMTSGVASSILGSANSAVQRMGGAGEAGQNFMHAAFQRHGALSPVNSMALAEGGLFGSRSSVFAKGGALSQYYSKQGVNKDGLAGGAGAEVTNYQAIKEHIDRMGGDPDLKLQGFQRLTGVSSLSNAAALYNMDPSKVGGLQKVIGRAGVDINSINESGLQTLAKVGSSTSKDGLNSIFSEMAKRTGKGALSVQDKNDWASAQGGSFEKMQDALIKIAAAKGQQETDATRMRDGMKAIEDKQIEVGNLLLKPLNAMRDALVVGSGMKSERALHDKFVSDAKSEINDRYDSEQAKLKGDFYRKKALAADKMRANYDVKNRPTKKDIDAIDAAEKLAMDEVDQRRNGELKDTDDAAIPASSSSAVSPKDAQIMQESGGRHRNADGSLVKSPKGALGISQVLPSSGANPGYGIEPLQGQTEADYLRFRDSYMGVASKRYGGDRKKALASYNAGIGRTDNAIAKHGDAWFSHMPKESQDYATKIMSAEGGATQMSEADRGRGASKGGATDTVHVVVTTENKMIGADGRTLSTKTAKATVPLPRGSGTRSVSVDAS